MRLRRGGGNDAARHPAGMVAAGRKHACLERGCLAVPVRGDRGGGTSHAGAGGDRGGGQEKEQEMELAYVSAPVGLAMLDADLRYVRINKHLADINGFSIDAHIGKSIHEMVPEIAEQAEAPFRQVLATGKPILGIEFQGSVISQP